MCAAVPPDAVVIGDGGATTDVTAGRRQTLTCRAVGGLPAPTITWESPPGRAVDLDPAGGMAVEQVTPAGRGGALSRLTLTPRKDDDGREFVCRVVNAAMSDPTRVSTRLRVLCESVGRHMVSLKANSRRDARHDKTVLSVSRPLRRCELDSRQLKTVADRKFFEV